MNRNHNQKARPGTFSARTWRMRSRSLLHVAHPLLVQERTCCTSICLTRAGSIWRIDCSKPHDEDEQQQYWHDSSKSLGRRVALSPDQF